MGVAKGSKIPSENTPSTSKWKNKYTNKNTFCIVVRPYLYMFDN